MKDTSVELKKTKVFLLNLTEVKVSTFVYFQKELPFPTDYPEERAEPLPVDICDPDMFQFSQPSITFDDVEDVPVKGVGAKVKKQAKARK